MRPIVTSRLYIIALAAFASIPPCWGQGLLVSDNVTASSKNVPLGAQPAVYAVPYAQIRLCDATCTNPAQMYSDQALTKPIQQPLVADVLGRYTFYVAPGNYNQQLYSSNGTTLLTTHPLQSTVPVGTVSNGTPYALSPPWGFSPSVNFNGQYLSIFDTVSSTSFTQLGRLARTYNIGTNLNPDFPGAPGASLATFEVDAQTSGGSNIQPSAIAGYCVNGGSQDCIGVSGRVVKNVGAKSNTSGIGDAAGMHGDAYVLDNSTNGLVMGVEASVYQNTGGTTPSDFYYPGAQTSGLAMHVNSLSTGGRALALIGMDAASYSLYGAWNGELMDNTVWEGANGAPANGTPGTVAWNGGDWDATKYPETGIKMGNAKQHLWCVYGHCIIVPATGDLDVFGGNTTSPTTGAGVNLHASTTQPSFINFWNTVGIAADIYWAPTTNTFTVNDHPIDTYINPNGGLVHAMGKSAYPASPSPDTVVNVGYLNQQLSATKFPYYSLSGGQPASGTHEAGGSGAIPSGASSTNVTISGAAAFTSASTYVCNATAVGVASPLGVTIQSGTSVTVYGASGLGFYITCVGY